MLRRRLVLVYAGRPRLSGDLHERVWTRYREGDAHVRNALASLKQCALSMNAALANGDLDTFGRLLNDNWSAQKALHPSITTSQLEEVFERAQKHGALGGKACGAGGGGCMVFLAEEGREAELRAALRASKLELIDFDFDTYGVFLKKG